MPDSVALIPASKYLLYVCRMPGTYTRHFLSLPVKEHLALLPGKLSAGSLLAWLLPFSDTWIGSQQSSCGGEREVFMNHGKCMLPSRKASRPVIIYQPGVSIRTAVCSPSFRRPIPATSFESVLLLGGLWLLVGFLSRSTKEKSALGCTVTIHCDCTDTACLLLLM